MKRKIRMILAALLLTPMTLFGQTYQQLWKQVEAAQQKDLPQTAIQHLQKIEAKAGKERAYGHLLKSTLLHARLQSEVSPDSLKPAVERLEQEEQRATDLALKAVYDAVLSSIYKSNPQLGDDWEARSQDYLQRAIAHPDVLAREKAGIYEPFVVKEAGSSYFGHDLLSVIGSELEAWEWMSRYYSQAGNRPAACLSAKNSCHTIQQLDSLIARYGDLPECGAVANERYELMDGETYTPAQRAAWLQESLRRWGTWQEGAALRNHWTVLTNPSFDVDIEHRIAEVNKPQTVRLNDLRHLQQLTMRVYRTSLTGDTKLDLNNVADYRQLKGKLTELRAMSRVLNFTPREDYEVFEDSLQLDALPAGVYMLEFASVPETRVARVLYFVSGVRVIMQELPGNKIRYVVVDATTGQPISGAQLRIGHRKGWNKPLTTQLLTCDKQGETVYTYQDSQRPQEVFAYTVADNYCPPMDGYYGRYSYYERNYDSEHINIFSDRRIYRPGQTVHAAAIVWKEQSPTDNTAVAGKQIKMELRDANYKLVAEQLVYTDRFGKCATQFTLPTGLLNGNFTLRANGAATSIRVEEYKRPTFQVEFEEYKQSYQNGDTVRVEGKAVSYAGVPVQGAKVHYVVRRRVAYWWLNYSWYWQGGYIGKGLEEQVVFEGNALTTDDGTFTALMPMVLPDDLKGQRMYYHFVVEADVTDMAGETHHGTMALPLGSKPTALVCDLPQQVRSDQLPKVTFTRCNAAGKEIAGSVRYRLDRGQWQECAANASISLFNAKCSSGEHRLEAVCEQDSLDMKFVVFGLDDKKPASHTHDWFYVSHSQFPNDGQAVTVQVGASDPDLHIVYGIFAGGKEIESGAVERDGELINRKLTYKEEYGSGLLVTYAWVKDGECYRHSHIIGRPLPDKRLKLTWETFRDRLTPGQQEQWRLKIMNPDGTPADASLMAVLYDKSLDQINPHQWSFSPSVYQSKPSTSWLWRAPGRLFTSGAKNYNLLEVPTLTFSHFDTSVYPYYHYMTMVRGARRMKPMMATSNSAVMVAEEKLTSLGAMDVAGNDESMKETIVVGYGIMKKKDLAGSVKSDDVEQQEVPMRENLQETAFFYPQLETDPQGGVTLSFMLPESLTTWRLMGIANTADMRYGSIEGETVARKELMVQPNIPRFLHVGDQATLSARIINTGEQTLSGTALLRLLDADTQKEVLTASEPFTLEAGKTTAVTFRISAIALKPSLYICRVSAVGTTAGQDGFSDGEQHYLPVLSDREYVTKTVPYTQHEPGVKTIDLTKLFPQGTTQQKMTVEYTNNPAWLMVQSLPTLGQPWEHSAIDQAASYYSNLLAKRLLAQSPQVKTVFEQWKRERTAQSSLHSQIEKNQELKDLVLAETPWVVAADREEEQRQRLADFFDENGIANRLSMAVEKLQKLQHADGSFSWFPGMEGSTYITVAVEEMLIRLNRMTGKQDDTQQLQDKAFDYIGRQMIEVVNEIKRQEKKGVKPLFPSFTALRWLYLCALDGRQLSHDVKSANDYLIALLKKDIKRQTIYEKALTAIVLDRHGDSKQAREYVRSLKEYTVYTEEMGRYYDTPRASYSWYDYKIPTEVAAIEAIQTVMPQERQTIDEMRRWLLQEKRTQAWDTPINSVNAIWAFLNDNSSLLATKEQTVLAVDGSPIDTPQATAALGYVKTTVDAPKGRTFTATKTGEGTSWGAVYAQFLQKTSEVEASQSGISVKREVMPAEKTQGTVAVGDRIKVRITIETTRDLDFVQVVDRRAACMEPVRQLSGYHQGAYVSPKDCATHYFYYGLAKGKHVIETEYYIDRAGQYETGTCTVQCAYAPEYRGTAPSMVIKVNE